MSSFELADTLRIEIPSSTSANFSRPDIISESGVEYICAYNYLDHSISVMSLTDRSYLRKVALSREGPNFVDTVLSMSFVNKDTLLIESQNYLTFVDTNGLVTKRVGINRESIDVIGLDFLSFELRGSQYSGLQFDLADTSVLMEVNPLNRKQSQKYTGSKLAKFYLMRGEVELLNIHLPEGYNALDGDYGSLTRIGYERLDSHVIYNFQMSADIFTTQNRKSYRLESRSTEAFATPISDFSHGFSYSRALHQMKSLTYYPVFFDSNKDLFYRIHKSAVDDVEDTPEFHIMVSDETFQELYEVAFPKGYYIYPIVSMEGLMFMAYNKYDDKLELINYRFELRK